jgi:adenine-specific DNA-methyltransferase
MNDARKKFQDLLRELFQFDCADLDFGIYRIMNQKRALIEQFIEKDLLDSVAKELKKGALKEQGELTALIQKLAAKIREDIADDAIDADGKLDQKHKNTKLGKKYIELQQKAAGASSTPELEAQIFNLLWAFFSRYYDNGDFLSNRRYSRREKYAIPYNGEEIYLHWANRDQYYIKTGENFTDYQWRAGDVSVLFKLVQAETEKDNVKADTKRFFVPRLDDVSVEKKTVTILFEYRGLTEQESISFGKKNQQDVIIDYLLDSLPKRKTLKDAPSAMNALMTEYRRTEKGESVSQLEHHLHRYTGKNTRDYFVHKDLAGFLARELDFYLKNEVLALDDLESAGADRADAWFQLLQAIRAIGVKIITFLAQIENFQKRIFEKRKFVTETNYCFTLDRVPETLWLRILKNKEQIEEWKKLYSIEELKSYSDPLKKSFIKAWPSLMIDTKFFADDHEFVDTLLAAQQDLEESLGGLLIHSENFQALNLLLPRFKERVKCIYIDPPYNSDASPIAYKNGYKSSSWCALMRDRTAIAREFLEPAGDLVAAVDDVQYKELRFILTEVFGAPLLGTFCVRSNPSGRPTQTGYAVSHEYLLFAGSPMASIGRLPATEDQLERFSERDEKGDFEWRNLRREGSNSDRSARRFLFYPIFIKGSQIRVPRMTWDDIDETWIVEEKPKSGEQIVWPVNDKGDEKTWRWEWKTVMDSLDQLCVRKNRACNDYVYYKRRPNEEGVVSVSSWFEAKYSATEHGTALLKKLFGKNPFSYPKSIHAVVDSIYVAGASRINSTVFDFFGGSGTTAHAVITLNRTHGEGRKYILAEMETYFDSVLKPRIQKVVFSSDWKDGRPIIPQNGKSSGISHAFKYIRLESYEDAMGNIVFESSQAALKFHDYVLRYMLEFETQKSETMLNAEKLAAPFSYQLDIMDGGERKTKHVDLPETFNYLLGLKVSSRRTCVRDGDHRYLIIRGTTNPHGEGGERAVVVIWRDVIGWKPADFKADAEFVKKEKLGDDADDVLVNADSVVPGARVLDPIFKERMFAPVIT